MLVIRRVDWRVEIGGWGNKYEGKVGPFMFHLALKGLDASGLDLRPSSCIQLTSVLLYSGADHVRASSKPLLRVRIA